MAFIFAILALFVTVVIAFLWTYAEEMVPAPKYTNTPIWIIVVGGSLAIFIASTHWHWLSRIDHVLPHIGW